MLSQPISGRWPGPSSSPWTRIGRRCCLALASLFMLSAPCHGNDLVNILLLRGSSEAAFKQKLERQAIRKVEATSAACELSPEQADQLRLMAQGDVNRAMQKLTTLRQATNNVNSPDIEAGQEGHRLVQQFIAQIQVGLHGQGSLFAKHLEHALDESQRARYQQYLADQEKQRHHLIVLNAVTAIDERMPLLKAQREKLVELIDQRPIPKAERIADTVVAYIRLSRIPQSELRTFLDEEQVQFIVRMCVPYQRMGEAKLP